MKKLVSVLAVFLMLSGCLYSTFTYKDGNSVAAQVVKDVIEEESSMAVQEEESVDTEAEQSIETEEIEEIEETVTEEILEEDEEKEIVVTEFEQPKTMYATIALNVRKGPGTEYDVVSHLSMAQAIEVTGQADSGWYQFMVDGNAVYASNNYLSETKVEIPTPTPTPAAEQPASPPATEPQQQTPSPTATVAPAGVIMVGDSRCVQMQAAVGGGGCSWVCENSKEYTWFSQTAIPKFDQYVGKGTKVVINMGVNDPEHYKDYVNLINAKAAEWAGRGARTYLVSVNPVWENPYVTQEQVDTFNANVPGMLIGVKWIDTSSWLNVNGYRLLDGLHYDDPTYVNIFNLIMGNL